MNFAEWSRVATLQRDQGEINASVLNAIKVQSAQQSMQKQLLSAEREGLIAELNAYLRNTDESIVPATDSIHLISMNSKFTEVMSHPFVELSDALIAQKKAFIRTEKNKLAPDFNLGYSNLSIIGWQTPDGLTQKYYGAGTPTEVFITNSYADTRKISQGFS